jgi:hypothetical protein
MSARYEFSEVAEANQHYEYVRGLERVAEAAGHYRRGVRALAQPPPFWMTPAEMDGFRRELDSALADLEALRA